ncbi:MAG TPA: SDR family oxidoreductase [Ktedonobacteraceae bacterium]
MRVFVTGATGFIGSAIVRELLSAGHQVIGLARSDTAAASLVSAGAEVQRGALDDLASLRSGAAAADGVIHTAFIHDFSDLARSLQTERSAIETLGTALEGSKRPFVITTGTALLPLGRLVTEEDAPTTGSFTAARGATEEVALSFARRGARVAVVRPAPSVHGNGDTHGFVTILISIARARGVSAYPGDGSNRWSAVHRLDIAHLYRLALETAPAGTRLHGVGDEGVPLREIASVIGQHLNLPVVSLTAEDMGAHFGWFAAFASLDNPASNTLTQQLLGWHPTGPGLIADLAEGHYFKE